MVTTLIDKTTLAKTGKVDQRWFLVDAQNLVLGRLASDLAMILMGKHTPRYTAHVDTGDFVVVINAEKIKITGMKLKQEAHDYYTYYPGGHKYVSWERLYEKFPERLLELAVRRMLPKTKMGRAMFKKLKVYRVAKHSHQAQCPVQLDLSNGLAKAMVKISK
jgi:large subunit ribosomal protein L13